MPNVGLWECTERALELSFFKSISPSSHENTFCFECEGTVGTSRARNNAAGIWSNGSFASLWYAWYSQKVLFPPYCYLSLVPSIRPACLPSDC